MKRISILHALTIIAVISFAFRGAAQTNSWTKLNSGLWHEAFWSLGVLPAASQSHIFFTNAGWKALAVDSVTARDFPDSLTIPRLTVASPTNTMNTLLLNFAGVQTPLRVAESFELGSNSVLLTLLSALEVGDDFFVDGTVNHGDLSEVSASSVYVGNSSPGVYNFSNGLVSAGNVIVGDGTAGSFHQSGGQLSLGGQLRLGRGDPFTFATGNGRFELTAGTLIAPTIQIGEARGRLGPPGADGTFVQSGGSNAAGRVLLGWPDSDTSSFGDYIYILNDGLLTTSNTVVYGGSGDFAQFGGVHHVDGPLALAGFYGRSFTPFAAQYTLSGGVVTARSLHIDFGTMSQSAGSNQISGDVVVGVKEAFSRHAFYTLSGGTLGASNTFVIDSAKGSFSQSGGTHIVRNLLEIGGSSGASAPGYTLSGGVLSAGDIEVRTNGAFNQSDGNLGAGRFNVASGEYLLSGGHAQAGNLYVGNGATGKVHQTSGTFWPIDGVILGLGDARNELQGWGSFEFEGGSLRTSLIQLGTVSGYPGSPGGEGRFVQSGGTNGAGRLVVGTLDSFDRNENVFILNAGTLTTLESLVHPDSRFEQSGGLHWVNDLLAVRGNVARSTARPAEYTLSNGLVHAMSLEIELASFMQLGGTNEVEGDLRLVEVPFGHSEYVLTAGLLQSRNSIVSPSRLDTFIQRGGTNIISGTLDLPARIGPPVPTIDSANYRLQGGLLGVRDIRVGFDSTFAHVGGSISHTGMLTLAGGRWLGAAGEHPLGTLKLSVAPTNSSLVLDDNASIFRFANSSKIMWAGLLVIHNWRGSTNTGGPQRIFFGTNESGLTAQQLTQIRFRNPAGFAAGDYSTTILNTGEIVPLEPTGPRPAITYQQNPGQLRLEWPSGYTLQTATNIVGPFEDVNTNSPYTLDTTADPQRFFRFRQ